MGFDFRKIRQGFCDCPGSVSGVTELEIFFNHTFDCHLQLHQLVAAVIIIGGGLPVFPGTASSCGVASALEESVSMVAGLRGAKKLRVTTTFGEVSTASGAAVGTALLEVGAVSSVLCLFRLRTSLKPSSWVAADFGVLDWLDRLLALSTAFNS
jgi:hypothetical protein